MCGNFDFNWQWSDFWRCRHYNNLYTHTMYIHNKHTWQNRTDASVLSWINLTGLVCGVPNSDVGAKEPRNESSVQVWCWFLIPTSPFKMAPFHRQSAFRTNNTAEVKTFHNPAVKQRSWNLSCSHVKINPPEEQIDLWQRQCLWSQRRCVRSRVLSKGEFPPRQLPHSLAKLLRGKRKTEKCIWKQKWNHYLPLLLSQRCWPKVLKRKKWSDI